MGSGKRAILIDMVAFVRNKIKVPEKHGVGSLSNMFPHFLQRFPAQMCARCIKIYPYNIEATLCSVSMHDNAPSRVVDGEDGVVEHTFKKVLVDVQGAASRVYVVVCEEVCVCCGKFGAESGDGFRGGSSFCEECELVCFH